MNFQLATNTLERVAPLTHAVGNVLKRVFVIGFSILAFGNYRSHLLLELVIYSYYNYFFLDHKIRTRSNNSLLTGNKISTQTGIGTCIAIAGVAIYSYIKAKMEEEKLVSIILSHSNICYTPYIHKTIETEMVKQNLVLSVACGLHTASVL